MQQKQSMLVSINKITKNAVNKKLMTKSKPLEVFRQ